MKTIQSTTRGTWNRTTLLIAFADRMTVTLQNSIGQTSTGVISSIQHEDGSGLSFNITFEVGHTIYWHAKRGTINLV